jgi:hypothetical protein
MVLDKEMEGIKMKKGYCEIFGRLEDVEILRSRKLALKVLQSCCSYYIGSGEVIVKAKDRFMMEGHEERWNCIQIMEVREID